MPRYQAEFNHWLQTERGTVFDSLTSKDSRRLFEKFAKAWNEGRLEQIYYTGLPAQLREKSMAYTAHKWGFAKKLSSQDARVLQSAKDTVLVATHASKERPSAAAAAAPGAGWVAGGGGGARMQVMPRTDDGGKRGRDEQQQPRWTSARDRVSDFEAKERATMDELKRSLGLRDGQRIQIAPRST